jgi:hypothetical protein
MDAATLRGDVEGRERVRREFGVGGWSVGGLPFTSACGPGSSADVLPGQSRSVLLLMVFLNGVWALTDLVYIPLAHLDAPDFYARLVVNAGLAVAGRRPASCSLKTGGRRAPIYAPAATRRAAASMPTSARSMSSVVWAAEKPWCHMVWK